MLGLHRGRSGIHPEGVNTSIGKNFPAEPSKITVDRTNQLVACGEEGKIPTEHWLIHISKLSEYSSTKLLSCPTRKARCDGVVVQEQIVLPPQQMPLLLAFSYHLEL